MYYLEEKKMLAIGKLNDQSDFYKPMTNNMYVNVLETKMK